MTGLSIEPSFRVASASPRDGLPQPTAESTPPREMAGQCIICFAKDWEEDPTSNNHIMRLLAQKNRVLWLNSIATRIPSLRSGRDISKIFRKIVSCFRGPKQVADNLWVYTPLVLPFPHSRLATRLNTWILRIALALIRRYLAFLDFQLWVFIPTAAPYVGKLGESMVVYYVTDEYSKFAHVDAKRMAKDDRLLCKNADVIFATAQSLVNNRLALNAETHLSRHGVDHRLFATALDDATPVPADIASLQKPVLGFYGALQHWLDYELLEYLARRHPDWSIALIGHPVVDVSGLRQFSNVHLLGRKPHHELPAYCRGMSVALIPHQVCELTRHMNPIKLREYLSAGLPLVSVDLPEVQAFSRQCRIARSYGEFEGQVEEALRSDSPQARQQRSADMRSETWERRVAELGRIVMRVRSSREAGEI